MGPRRVDRVLEKEPIIKQEEEEDLIQFTPPRGKSGCEEKTKYEYEVKEEEVKKH